MENIRSLKLVRKNRVVFSKKNYFEDYFMILVLDHQENLRIVFFRK